MHIVIPNAHWNNRGDEAAHRALWEQLRLKYPESRITVLFKDKKPITCFPDFEGITYFSCQFKAAIWDIWLTCLTRGVLGKDSLLKEAVKVLKTADLIIYPPGGSVINDRFFWSKQMEYLVPFICARLYQIPMFVAAPSIGPFDINKARPLRTWLLKTPKVFCVREAISQKYLESIGVCDNVHVTMDLAFMSSVNTDENEKKLDEYCELKDFMKIHDKVVGMTISDFKWHITLGKDQDLMPKIDKSFRDMIQYLTDKGYGVLLIPQLFGNQNDVDYLRTFADNDQVFVLSEAMDSYFQQFIVSKLYAVIGMRYHCNIFAAKMGTPFIAVSYEEKMTGFLEMAKSEYCISLDNLCFECLKNKFDSLEENYKNLSQKLHKEATRWKDNALKTISLMFY